jgi:hypothetical protein
MKAQPSRALVEILRQDGELDALIDGRGLTFEAAGAPPPAPPAPLRIPPPDWPSPAADVPEDTERYPAKRGGRNS